MKFVVLTIFPEMFVPFWEHGIIRKAIERNSISASTINIRDFAEDRHHTTDDRPYGGGCGMVMKPGPLAGAIQSAKKKSSSLKTILLTPQGRVFNQIAARELSASSSDGFIMVCGRYEGVDERICNNYIDDEISIGDYVLTGGELAAMVVIEAVVRLIPGVLGGADSAEKDSFSEGLIEHAHYTRPRTFENLGVPDVLLSGNHKEIEKWRLETSLVRTFLKRPDMLKHRVMSRQELEILEKWRLDIGKIIQAQSLRGSDTLSRSE